MLDRKATFYEKVVKRFFDIVISLIVLIMFSWLFLILAILVRVNLGSPILFHHDRPGRIDPKTGKEKIFRLYKFRSMTNECDSEGKLLPREQRMTKFGTILRKTSLDELPEVWNILIGDMSIVGPRPLWDNYLEYYNDFERRRHLVTPGLTGWAQVNGRNHASWGERFKMDNEYVDKISFLFDIKIILLTVKKVFAQDGVEFAKNHQTIMEYFETHNDK